jgi:HAD superfamily hydrolase (TIGR01450 family)
VPDLAAHDGFALDIDGVVWLSKEPIAGSPEAVAAIREHAATVFLTNDPRSTREEVAANLDRIGVPTSADDVVTSASATAETIAAERPGASVLSIGRSALNAELERLGIEALRPAEGARAEVVVIGGASDMSAELLRIAHGAVGAGGELWATNADPAYPTARGIVPGTGAFVAAVEYSTGARARVPGKPHHEIFDRVREHLGAATPLMVGDSLDADIAGAAGAGMTSALVLTGRASEADLDGEIPAQPDFVFQDLAGLAAVLGG